MTKYLFRVDDVAEEMSNWGNFEKLCKVFTKYKIKPIIAVIPDNQDPEIKGKKHEGWIDLIKDFTIAQHGYQHIKRGKGEFYEAPYDVQYLMLERGKEILEKQFGKIIVYVPPWHHQNENTSTVLTLLGFFYISNGWGICPRFWGLLKFIPVNDWKISRKLFGVRTLTMHAQDITKEKIEEIEQFIKDNRPNIIRIEESNYKFSYDFLDGFYIPYFWFRYSHYSPLYQIVKWFKK